MELRKVEIVSPKLIIGTVTYYAGDVKSFPKTEADDYIYRGWAKDFETGEQGDRIPGAQRIKVNDAVVTPES